MRSHPWTAVVAGTLVAVAASLVRDLVHEPGTVGVADVVAIAVTVAGGVCAMWGLVVVMRRRTSADPS